MDDRRIHGHPSALAPTRMNAIHLNPPNQIRDRRHCPARRRLMSLASITCIAAACTGVSGMVLAADDDPAAASVKRFCAVLLDTMKMASKLPIKARYDKLEPAVRAAFDLPAMTRIAVGPVWNSLPAEQQKALIEVFSRMTIATYASRFDGYSGERFEVDPTAVARGAQRVVRTKLLQPKDDPVVLDYLSHMTAGGWQITDVYLNGTISELATRRSDFASLLKPGDANALIASLKQRNEKMLAG